MYELWDILLQRCDESVDWGFEIEGRCTRDEDIRIKSVSSHSLAARNLTGGDIVLKIQHQSCKELENYEISDLINSAELELQLLLKKPLRKVILEKERKNLITTKFLETERKNIITEKFLEIEEKSPDWLERGNLTDDWLLENNWKVSREAPIKCEAVPDWRKPSTCEVEVKDPSDNLVVLNQMRKEFFREILGKSPVKSEVVPDWRISDTSCSSEEAEDGEFRVPPLSKGEM